MEIWKAIKDYEGVYEVSNLGRVKSLIIRSNNYKVKRENPLILKLCMTKRDGKRNNKLGVVLSNKNKRCIKFIGTLVLNTFIGDNPKGRNQAVHKNGDRFNCKLTNLFWGKPSLYQNY